MRGLHRVANASSTWADRVANASSTWVALRRRGPLLAAAASALAIAAGGCSAKPLGQVILVVQTDLSLPKDIDAIRIEVTSDGVPKFQNDYERLGSPDGQILLPGTLSLVASSTPNASIDVIVSARRGGKDGTLRIVSEVVTTVPSDRAATMQMPLQFLCDGQGAVRSGNVVSSCPAGQSCVAGRCAKSSVDSSTLPDYDPNAVFGDGSCFDVAACFGDPNIVDVDPDTCTFDPGPADVNVALETQGDGICDAIGCFVPLDANSDRGWQRLSSGKLQLPPGVCDQLMSGSVTHVVTTPVSAACHAKQTSLPTCGAWSTGSNGTAPYSGPLALAGGQDHPAALAIAQGKVVWVNASSPGLGTGAVKTVTPFGGTPETISQPTETAPRDVATSGDKIFWTSAPANGGQIHESGVASPIFTHPGAPEGITVAAGGLFWTDFQSGSIYSASLSGAHAAPLAQGNYPYRIVGDDRYVYWTNEGSADSTTPDGSLARYDFQNGGVNALETLADTQVTPRELGLELDATGRAARVYWATFAAQGALMRLDLASGTPEVLVANLAYPNGVAIDATDVYWTNRGDGTVMKLPLTSNAGDAPTTLASGQVEPGAIALDDSAVYWINAGPSTTSQGAVIKLAKAR